MGSDNNPNAVLRYSTMAIFLMLGLLAFWAFASNAVEIFLQTKSLSASISFNRGSLRLLGVSIVLLALTTYMALEIFGGKPPTDKTSTLVSRSAIGGLILLFLLPHLVHYPLENFLFKHGYKICELKSHRWLAYQKIVYVSRAEECFEQH